MDASPCKPVTDASEPPERLVLEPRAAVLLDVDGTLLDIAPSPDLVIVPAEFPGLLARLRDRLGGALALVSGRPIADLDRLFAPVVLAAAGEHGAEVRHGAGEPTLALTAQPSAVARVFARMASAVAGFAGVRIEAKRAGFAVHYRQAPDRASLLRGLVDDAVADDAAEVHVQPGKMVLEVKDRTCSKAQAVHVLMQRPPFAGRRPVFIGDDATDRDGFAAVRQLGGHCVAVGLENADIADWCFASPAAVRAWLSRVVARGGADG